MQHRRRSLCRVLAAIPVVIVLGLAGQAQTTSGTLSGSVSDPGGRPLAGAQVTATSETEGSSRSAITGGDGRFSFPVMRAGRYRVTVSLAGYPEGAVSGVEVTIGGRINLAPIVLQPPRARAATQPRAEEDVTPIQPDTPIRREIASGQSHVYGIALKSGQYVTAIVERPGSNLVTRVFGPSGRRILEAERPTSSPDVRTFSVLAPETGLYRLEVRSLDPVGDAKMYTVRTSDQRTATEEDKQELAARRAFAEGERLRAQRAPEALRAALEQYEQALAYWRASGERDAEIVTLSTIGDVYEAIGEKEKALEFHKRATGQGGTSP